CTLGERHDRNVRKLLFRASSTEFVNDIAKLKLRILVDVLMLKGGSEVCPLGPVGTLSDYLTKTKRLKRHSRNLLILSVAKKVQHRPAGLEGNADWYSIQAKADNLVDILNGNVPPANDMSVYDIRASRQAC